MPNLAPKPSLIPHLGDLAAWSTDTFFALGQRTVANGNVYEVVTQGTSAGVGTGPSGTGSSIADGTVEWDYQAAVSTAWASTTGYTLGDVVTNDGGKLYQALNTNTSGSSGGPTGTGGVIADGGMLWAYVGSAVAIQTAPTTRAGDLGAVPGAPAFASYENWWKANILPWIYFIRDRFDVFGYSLPFTWERTEDWIYSFTTSTTGAIAGTIWYAESDSVGSNLIIETRPTSSSRPFPSAVVRPGDANGNNYWLTSRPDLNEDSGLSRGWFYMSPDMLVVLEWMGEISVVGANNTTWAMGLTDTTSAGKITAAGDFVAFRKASGNTNWIAVCASSTTETTTDTGVAPAANTRQRFLLALYGSNLPGGAQALFYIDGELVATHTTNVPSAVVMLPSWGGLRTAGSLTSSMRVYRPRFAVNLY